MGDRISLLNQNITPMNCRSNSGKSQYRQDRVHKLNRKPQKLKTNKYVQVYLKRVSWNIHKDTAVPQLLTLFLLLFLLLCTYFGLPPSPCNKNNTGVCTPKPAVNYSMLAFAGNWWTGLIKYVLSNFSLNMVLPGQFHWKLFLW